MKRTVSVLLALVMCLGLLQIPAPAHAAGDVAINAANFPDEAFRNYVAKNYDTDGSGALSAEEIEAAVVLYVYGEGITSLQGVEYLTSLKELACPENQLTELDLSRNTALEAVFCDNNQLTSLDVSGCSALWLLHCYDNSLTELDVSRNTALKELQCNGNQLAGLNVSGAVLLETLRCYNNQLTELDVSNNPALTVLDGELNQLAELDVRNNSALLYLSVGNNRLTALDVTGNTALKTLFCYGNSLTELDVSRNRALEYLSCSGNQLTALDISHCPRVLKAVTSGTKSDEGDYWRYQFETPDAYWCSLYLLDVDKTVELITEGPALSYGVTVGDVEITEDNMDDVLGDGSLRYDPDTKTLTCTNAVVDGNIEAQDDLTIDGDLSAGAIKSLKTLTILDGKVTATNPVSEAGLYAADLVIAGGEVDPGATHPSEGSWYSLQPNTHCNTLTVSGGTVQTVVLEPFGGEGFEGTAHINISGGEIAELRSTQWTYGGFYCNISGGMVGYLPGGINDSEGFWMFRISGGIVNSAVRGIDFEFLDTTERFECGAIRCFPMFDGYGGIVLPESLGLLEPLGGSIQQLTDPDTDREYYTFCDAAGSEAAHVVIVPKTELPPVITAQPKSVSAYVGATAKFTVGAAGTALKYQWQYKYPGESWKNSGYASGRTAALSFAAQEKNNKMQVRCRITDANGNSVTSSAVTLTIVPKITAQPENTSAAVGAAAKFTITATGAGLTYQWQYKYPDGSWTNSGYASGKTAALSFTAQAKYNNVQYRCKITDTNGKTVTSSAVKLTIIPKITAQPAAASATVGAAAKFTVTATGAGLTYQWQYKYPDGSWTNSGYASGKTAALSFTAQAKYNNVQYRCRITDANGKTITSSAVKLTINPKITAQPASTSAAVGAVAKFTVTATGAGLKYQWQYKYPDGSWTNSGYASGKTASLSFAAQAKYNNVQYRCRITDANGKTLTSSAVKLTIIPKITAQPKSVTAAAGATAKFTVTATGAGLKYQWQYKYPDGSWTNSGYSSAKTATLSVPVQAKYNGMQYRCVITDANGKTVTSSAAVLTVR